MEGASKLQRGSFASAGKQMGAVAGGADPLEGGVPREAEAATEPRREEEPVPGPSSWDK